MTVYDVGVHERQCYIVSDYLKGSALDEWIAQNPPTFQQSARIVADLAEALAHAHDNGIVHRDVKPANVILRNDREPVLVDFGLALSAEDLSGSGQGLVSGTPNYMSPEQARGEGNQLDGRIDIYALGVVFYLMLTGRLPFKADNVMALLRLVSGSEPPPQPREIAAEIPADLERICMRAMAKKIGERYATADQMATDLRVVLREFDDRAVAVPDRRTVELTAAGPGSMSAELSESTIRRTREAERRQVTVLYCECDLFDSVEFMDNFDADEQHALLHDYRQACDKAVQRFGGSILQATDQGLLVCFGYPMAYEDAGQRAVRTAMGLLDDVKRMSDQLEQDKQTKLSVWIGIHTGIVVAGNTDLEGGEPMSIVGEARNVTMRLENVSKQDSIVVTAATYELVNGFFNCESRGTHSFKGVPRPIEVYELTSETEHKSRIDVAESAGLTPLIGRDTELSVLRERWEQAVDGMEQVVLLNGDAGLGKSRLIRELKQHVARSDDGEKSELIEWRCSAYYDTTGLHPVADYFERTLQLRREDSPTERLDKLVEHLKDHNLDAPDVVPLFAAFLSIPLGDRYPALGLTPQKQRDNTLAAVVDLLHEYAYDHPVLFIVEDLHWIDPTTLELLEMLIDQASNDPLFILLAFRPEFEPAWKSRTHHTLVALNRLTKRQIGEMMQQKSGIANLPAELVEKVIEKTDGVPLFIEEFTTMVMESGAIREVDGQVELNDSFSLDQIPASLQDLLMARLDRMDSDREVVQLGAALGREFSYELFDAVSTLDATTLKDELTKLVDAELLLQRGRIPRCRYTFKQALIQDAAYNSLLKGKRQTFHQTIAYALQQQFADVEQSQPELLAHHFTEAGLTEPAIDYWQRAGQMASERSANREAIDQFKKALELVATQPESAERHELELGLQIALAAPLSAVKGYVNPEVEQAYTRARELCQHQEQTELFLPTLHGLYRFYVVRGDLETTLELTDDILNRAEQIQDPDHTLEAHRSRSLTLFFMGRFAEARQYAETGYSLYDIEKHRSHAFVYGVDPSVVCLTFWAWSAWKLGFPDLALEKSHEVLELSKKLAHPHSRAFALAVTGSHYQARRDYESVAEIADETIALAKEHGFPYWIGWGSLLKGWAKCFQADADSGVETMQKSLAAWKAAGVGLARPLFLARLAEGLQQASRIDDGLVILDEAEAIVDSMPDMYSAELQRLRGELLLARNPGNPEAAESCFRNALEIARQQESKSLELRAATSLCKLQQLGGDDAAARQSLQDVYDSFSEGHDTADLVAAQALLKS